MTLPVLGVFTEYVVSQRNAGRRSAVTSRANRTRCVAVICSVTLYVSVPTVGVASSVEMLLLCALGVIARSVSDRYIAFCGRMVVFRLFSGVILPGHVSGLCHALCFAPVCLTYPTKLHYCAVDLLGPVTVLAVYWCCFMSHCCCIVV